MTNEARRKQRRRGRRSGESRSREMSPAQMATARTVEAPWQWRTFPVFFAFALGALLMAMLVWMAPGAFYILLITAVFLSVFGVAHYFGRSLREYRANDDEDET